MTSTNKKIQIITLKKPQKLPDDFIPKKLKIVTEAIETVFNVALDIMKKDVSSPTSPSCLFAASTAAFCKATCPNDVSIAAERLVVNHTSPQLWQSLRSISSEKAEKFVETVLELSRAGDVNNNNNNNNNNHSTNSNGNSNNNNNSSNVNILIMKNLSKLWMCWSNAVHFIEHLLSWLERGSNSMNINNSLPVSSSSSSSSSNVVALATSSSSTIRATCFSIISDKLMKQEISSSRTVIIQNAIDGFMTCLLQLRRRSGGSAVAAGSSSSGGGGESEHENIDGAAGDGHGEGPASQSLTANVQSLISDMSQLKSILMHCGCYGDEDDALSMFEQIEEQGGGGGGGGGLTADSAKSDSQLLFLPRYLKETFRFYRREAEVMEHVDQVDCEEFVRRARARLVEETQRAQWFLAPFSRSFAEAALQKTLISIPFEGVIDRGFAQVVAKVGLPSASSSAHQQQQHQQQQQHTAGAGLGTCFAQPSRPMVAVALSPEQVVKRLYILSGLPNVHFSKRQKLLDAFKLFATSETTMLMSSAASTSTATTAGAGGGALLAQQQHHQQELQMMVPNLLQFYTRMDSIVIGRCFNGDTTFRLRFRESMEKGLRHRQAKFSELVARQFDVLLREGDRSSAANNILLTTSTTTATGNISSGNAGAERGDDNVGSHHKNASSAETTLAALEKLARFARLVPARDIFESFYMRDLARRLLQFRNINEDLEHTAISRLKVFCGPQIATRCNGMMKDIELSRGFVTSVGESLREFDPNGKLEPLVLTQGYWPSASAGSSSSSSLAASCASPSAADNLAIPLPQEFNLLIEGFNRLYCNEFKKRKLAWSPLLSSAVVKAKFTKGAKELTVSFIQTHILLMLNAKQSITDDEVKKTLYDHQEFVRQEEATRRLRQLASEGSGSGSGSGNGGGGGGGGGGSSSSSSSSSSLSKSQLEAAVNETVDLALVSLVAAKILNKDGASSKPSSPTTEAAASSALSSSSSSSAAYSVNVGFTHRQVKIRIAQVQKKHQEQSNEETVRSTLAQRSHTVDAAIARIMKARKRVGHWDLVTQTIESTKLPLDPADVKKRIETLIDKDFMKRDSDDPSTYVFVA